MSQYQKHTMMLHPGDFEKLQRFYPEVGASAVVRALIRAHLKKIEASDKPVEGIEVEL